MEFTPLSAILPEEIKPYLRNQCLHLSDFSCGFLFMWQKTLHPLYAIVEGCLVIEEFYAGRWYFHYPVSLTGDREEELAAVAAVEKYCRASDKRLHFTNVPESRIADMVCRYPSAAVSNNRRWRDYLYLAEDFRTFAGKKYAGQRNHVRKFEKLYPDWSFSKASLSDMGALEHFLEEYGASQLEKHDALADEELSEVYAVLPHMRELGMFAGILRVGEKVVGFSAGERCGDMVIIHIEKALRGYEGAYPFLAQKFAETFAGDARYLNRMDDAGDAGLRKSKLQYHPCELVAKYNLIPHRAIDNVSKLPTLHTERLTLRPVEDEEADAYARLASDVERNRYWGYDWRTDAEGTPSPAWFLEGAREDFNHRREMPLGIFLEKTLVGEVVLHNFGYTAECEVGVRLLPDFEGMGYAFEAVKAYSQYAFLQLNIERVEAKCYRENTRSRAMLLRAGMRPCGEDATYFYFCRTAED